VIVGAADEAASWRSLTSHLHGEGRQNAKGRFILLEALHAIDWILGQVIRYY
jgi:hypothetical protein